MRMKVKDLLVDESKWIKGYRGFELGYCVGQKDKEIEELNRIKDLT